MDNHWLQRGNLILGGEKSARLSSAHILIVGLGGVGSWAAEMLCRSGVGRFTLVDADVVDVTNINRQMPALHSTVGEPKCKVVAERLRAINPEVVLSVRQEFIERAIRFCCRCHRLARLKGCACVWLLGAWNKNCFEYGCRCQVRFVTYTHR